MRLGKTRFTVVCDFAGGTYVSQFYAADPVDVVFQWATELVSEKPIPRASGYVAKSAIKDLNDGNFPVRLNNTTNVWQAGAWVGNKPYTATIIKTA